MYASKKPSKNDGKNDGTGKSGGGYGGFILPQTGARPGKILKDCRCGSQTTGSRCGRCT